MVLVLIVLLTAHVTPACDGPSRPFDLASLEHRLIINVCCMRISSRHSSGVVARGAMPLLTAFGLGFRFGFGSPYHPTQPQPLSRSRPRRAMLLSIIMSSGSTTTITTSIA